MLAQFLRVLQVAPVPAVIFLIFLLVRLPLQASVTQQVSARTRWERFRLAVAYVALFLVAALVVVLLIQPLVRAHAQHEDADPITIEQPSRTAPLDRLLKL